MARQVTLMGGEPEDESVTMELPDEVNGWEYDTDSRGGPKWTSPATSNSYVQIARPGPHSWAVELRINGERQEYLTPRTSEAAAADARMLMRNHDPGAAPSGNTGHADPYDPTEEWR